jgi:hypothetical protein
MVGILVSVHRAKEHASELEAFRLVNRTHASERQPPASTESAERVEVATKIFATPERAKSCSVIGKPHSVWFGRGSGQQVHRRGETAVTGVGVNGI